MSVATRWELVTGDGCGISATPRRHKKTACLGSQQNVLFHREENNDPDTRDTQKGPDTGDGGSARTVGTRVPAALCREATRYFEAQMTLENKVARDLLSVEVSAHQERGCCLSGVVPGPGCGQTPTPWLGYGLAGCGAPPPPHLPLLGQQLCT